MNVRFTASRAWTALLALALLLGLAGDARRRRDLARRFGLEGETLSSVAPLGLGNGTFSARPYVVDRNHITGAGVTAGVDLGLAITEMRRGRDYAEAVQLLAEYDPQPPFAAGTPEHA